MGEENAHQVKEEEENNGDWDKKKAIRNIDVGRGALPGLQPPPQWLRI